MSQWVLKANGDVVPRRSSRPLHVDELNIKTEEKKRETLDALIERRWGTSITPPNVYNSPDNEPWKEYHDNDESPWQIPEIEDTVDATGRIICKQPEYDKIINSEILLQHGDKVKAAKVIHRSLGLEVTVVGSYDENPFLNSIIYDVECNDGTVKEYSANVIAENMLTQVDYDGFSMTMMNGIIDHRKYEATAISKSYMYIVTRRGQSKMGKKTCGWSLLIQWKDET